MEKYFHAMHPLQETKSIHGQIKVKKYQSANKFEEMLTKESQEKSPFNIIDRRIIVKVANDTCAAHIHILSSHQRKVKASIKFKRRSKANS